MSVKILLAATSKQIRNTSLLGGTVISPYRDKIKPPVGMVAGDFIWEDAT